MRRPILGSIDLALAALLLIAVFGLLPARWWPVDVVGLGLAVALGAGGLGLVRGLPWGVRVARGAALATLVVGAGIVLALAFTAGHIVGLYGPVGSGGAVLFGVIAALVLPYLVILPALQLWMLLDAARPPSPAGATPSPDSGAT